MEIVELSNWTQTPESIRDKEKILNKLKEIRERRKSKLKGRYKDTEFVLKCDEIIENLLETIKRINNKK